MFNFYGDYLLISFSMFNFYGDYLVISFSMFRCYGDFLLISFSMVRFYGDYLLISFSMFRFYGDYLLSPGTNFTEDEFLDMWQKAVPEGIKTDLSQLSGLALIDTQSRPSRIRSH